MNCSMGENDKAFVTRIFFLIFFVSYEKIDIFAAVNNLLLSTIYRRQSLKSVKTKPLLATDKGRYAGTFAARVNKTILLT